MCLCSPAFVTGEIPKVRSSRIIAGQECERTNELLQALAGAVLKKLDSTEAVQMVLRGEKPADGLRKDKKKQKSVFVMYVHIYTLRLMHECVHRAAYVRMCTSCGLCTNVCVHHVTYVRMCVSCGLCTNVCVHCAAYVRMCVCIVRLMYECVCVSCGLCTNVCIVRLTYECVYMFCGKDVYVLHAFKHIIYVYVRIYVCTCSVYGHMLCTCSVHEHTVCTYIQCVV